MDDENRKKKYTVSRAAFFKEEIRANTREEAEEKFEKLESRFADIGDYTEGHIEVDDAVCPRCQTRIQEKHGNKESCEHCGLSFADAKENSAQGGKQ